MPTFKSTPRFLRSVDSPRVDPRIARRQGERDREIIDDPSSQEIDPDAEREYEALFGKRRRVTRSTRVDNTRDGDIEDGDGIQLDRDENENENGGEDDEDEVPSSQTFHTPRPRFRTQIRPQTQAQIQTPLRKERKPTFILPSQPEPESEDYLPSPFSPRRGNRRGPSYIPGGMASQVRSWVVEMGTRARAHAPIHDSDTNTNTNTHTEVYSERYLFTLDVKSVVRIEGGGFVRGTLLHESRNGNGNDQGKSVLNVLLLGSKRLEEGYHVGVFPGLVWDVEIASDSSDGQVEKWTVCIDWEIIS